MSSRDLVPPHPGWKHYFDDQDRCYYVNDANGATQWNHPTSSSYHYQQGSFVNNQQRKAPQQPQPQADGGSASLLSPQEQYYNSSDASYPPNAQYQSPVQQQQQREYAPPVNPQPYYQQNTNLPGQGETVDGPAAAQSDLPSGWFKYTDPHGRAYFYNATTNQVQWTHPTTGQTEGTTDTSTSQLPDRWAIYSQEQARQATYVPNAASPNVDYLADIYKVGSKIPDYERKLQALPVHNLDPAKYKQGYSCCEALTNGSTFFVTRACIYSCVIWASWISLLIGVIFWKKSPTSSALFALGVVFLPTTVLMMGLIFGIWYCMHVNWLTEIKLMDMVFDWKTANKAVIFDHISEYQAHEPSLSISAHCYHWETRLATGYRQRYINGHYITESYTYTERYIVTRHIRSHSVPIIAWVDNSPRNILQICDMIANDSVCTGVTYDQAYFLLPEQQGLVDVLKGKLYQLHLRCDVHCDVTEHYHGMDESGLKLIDTIVNDPESTRYQLSKCLCFNPVAGIINIFLLGCWLPAAIAYKTLVRNVPYHSLKTLYLGIPSWCDDARADKYVLDGDSGSGGDIDFKAYETGSVEWYEAQISEREVGITCLEAIISSDAINYAKGTDARIKYEKQIEEARDEIKQLQASLYQAQNGLSY